MIAKHHWITWLALSLLSLTSLVDADQLVVDQQPVCDDISTVNWQNDRLTQRIPTPPVPIKTVVFGCRFVN